MYVNIYEIYIYLYSYIYSYKKLVYSQKDYDDWEFNASIDFFKKYISFLPESIQAF